MQKINKLLSRTLTIQKPIEILLMAFMLINLVACSDGVNDNDKVNLGEVPVKVQTISPSDIALNNQGVGEMGSFDYDKATVTFDKLVIMNPKWQLAQQNLAIALLNRQKEGDEGRAMGIAESLLKESHSNLVAQYIAGILDFNQGLCEKALPRFNNIIKADSSDAYALYFAGQCHLQNGEVEQSLSLYQKAIKADGYLRSAYYGSFMAAQRLAKIDVAKEMLEAYQKLSSNPKARLAEIKYTRMGPKANAQAYSETINNQASPKIKTKPPYFKSPIPIDLIGVNSIQQYGSVNLNQTQNKQLYVVANNQLKVFDNLLKAPQELAQFTMDLESGEHKLAWGDINNDNKIDVYITGQSDQLYLQTDDGFDSVDMQSFGLNQLNSTAVRLIDADHDGDLDLLLLSENGRFELWNNNLDNTFIPLSKKISLPTVVGYQQILVEDIDSDRDVDIILIADNTFTILLNDRMWSYEAIYSVQYDSLINFASLSDNDINGYPELNVLFKDNKILSFEYDQLLKYYKNTQQFNEVEGRFMLQADINGNGSKEFLVQGNEEIRILDKQGKTVEQILLNNIKSYKLVNTINGPELLVLQGSQLKYVAASTSRSPYLLVDVSGKEDDANSVRSNFSGIGTSFVLHNRGFYAIENSFQNMTGYDQDYQATSIAAGNKDRIDYIAIDWSDGVYQTELALKTKSYYKITETQRQLSSCPVIFAWNNGQYEFISDVLGVGGIGFAVGRHEYGVPRPWENYLLTDGQFSSENGVFKLQFSEPMEESAYLDQLSIEVLDVPKEYSVTLDERMMIEKPQVTGQTLFYKDTIKPTLVLNKLNEDVTEQALKTDKIAIDIVNQDHRFLGLVDEQIITLEFANELQGEYHLVMNGWVEYGYSQTMFAAWQAGLSARAPTLEYKDGNEWKVVLTEFGYPAGMPRAATVPISLPNKTRFLRIRTNMEVYFDQLGLIQTEVPENIATYQLKLSHANVKQLGFPRRQDNEQRVPSYDYTDIEPFWDTRYMEGAYSQLGEVTELLEEQDNALAIIGAGESIELFYIDDLPQLEENHNRYYLLKFKGWAKDMDILTKDGETLDPIPFSGKVSARTKTLNQKYNTRFKAGR